MDFTYSNLASNELRLLSPLPGANNGNLRFKVSHVRRDRAPQYTAVSYTWGDGQPTEVIYLNGQAFHIRLNLWSCLHYLSLYARNGIWKYMWVDAICINQANDSERNAQVRLMDKTYTDAVSVSVWLGLIPVPEPYQYRTFEFEPIKTIDSDGFDWFDSIDDLANRPYWSRFWVIQEFLLGRHVQLFCSGNMIDWQAFQDILCHKADINPYTNVDDVDMSSAHVRSYSALPLVLGRHVDRHPQFFQPLYDLIVRHGRAKCKDSRDRVFALLGLIPSEDRAVLSQFFPNYTLSEDDVVIIALAHVRQINHKEIVPENEELFLGLGIESMERRRKLLRRAADFDSFDGMAPSEFPWRDNLSSGQDELERGENMNLIGSDLSGTSETSRPSTVKRAVISVLLLGAIVWGTIRVINRYWS